MKAGAAASLGLVLAFAAAAGVGQVAHAAVAPAEDDGTISVTIPGGGGGGDVGDGEIRDAELRWGVSVEANSGAFAGGCNFLSAGVAGDAGGAREWTASDGFYASESGNTSIVKPDASGEWIPATWETKCLDRYGSPVSSTSLTSTTEAQAVISGGTGEATGERVEISWTGSFTVAFYGGMSYWSASDPHLVMDADGNGTLTADLSGYASSREDMTQWAPISAEDVVIAEIRDAQLEPTGFAEIPRYLGVEAAVAGQAAPTLDNVAYWGAFPEAFMVFQERLGQAGYWMTTNGQRDRAKPATTLYVSYDASVPVDVTPPEQAPQQGTGQILQNDLGQRAPGGGSTTTTTTVAAASPAAAAAAFQTPLVDTATVSRTDGAGLIPDASGGWLSRFPLPGLIAMLAALVSALAAMHLCGIPVLPWMRPKP